VALERAGSGGWFVSVIMLYPMVSIYGESLTRVSPRRYPWIRYNPVAMTCTCTSVALVVLADTGAMTDMLSYVHASDNLL